MTTAQTNALFALTETGNAVAFDADADTVELETGDVATLADFEALCAADLVTRSYRRGATVYSLAGFAF